MKLKRIKYKGKEWDNYKDLVSHTNKLKPRYQQVTAALFDAKWRKWQRKNPESEPTTKLISAWLKSRAGVNSIYYKGIRYKGPSDLYNSNKSIANISYKSFHLNLKKNGGINEDYITACLKGTRVVSKEGTRISQSRKIWQDIEDPKVNWPRVSQQITNHRKVFGCEPTKQEIKGYCFRNTSEWLEKDSPSFGLSKKAFYNSITNIQYKCSLKSWINRVRKYSCVAGGVISESTAIELSKESPNPNFIIGILYIVKNIVNDKKYIGITTQTLQERKNGHFRQAIRKEYSSGSFQEAIVQFGKNSFIFTEVDKFHSLPELENAEVELIKKECTLSPFGYNLDAGGKGVRGYHNQKHYRGKTYRNLASLAEIHNLNPVRLASRIYNGWSLDEAIEVPKGMPLKSYKNGHEKPLKTKAMEAGVPHSKVYDRLKSGWTECEALEKVSRGYRHPNAIPITVKGRRFNSIRKAALFHQIPEGTIRKRLKLKWPIDEAFKSRR